MRERGRKIAYNSAVKVEAATGRERRLPGFLYADDLILCSGSEEDLRAAVESFIEVCRRRGQKVNSGKGKVMVLGGEEGVDCEVCVEGIV